MSLVPDKNVGIPKKTELPKGKNTGMAAIAYIVFFIPLLTEDRNDPFVKFHVKQGMILFSVSFVAGVLVWVPFIGQMLSPLVTLSMFILMIVGIIGAAKGEQKPLPLIGKYADIFNI